MAKEVINSLEKMTLTLEEEEIWGAPFDMASPKVAAEIGGRLGKVVEVERRKSQDTEFFHASEGGATNSKTFKERGVSEWLGWTKYVGVFQV
ncbi:hypothetical protein SO802_013824 [Lithocarpus litseifolius]|uniref:Uncharacterized protein n=1 Tax=Lithocarpus litseifolius TaxID=425828 RepID=A0AAW2D9D1_9ROSI